MPRWEYSVFLCSICPAAICKSWRWKRKRLIIKHPAQNSSNRKGEVYAYFFTAILGSLPSRKLFIVPNSPSWWMGNASFSTLVFFNNSKWACETSIFARIASLSSCWPSFLSYVMKRPLKMQQLNKCTSSGSVMDSQKCLHISNHKDNIYVTST